ncbi:NupC/NupG family nucleoside CNT transporter [bacterium]|nr:NupC/NupG family nucleoside CNT transporter [bacterium]
MDRFIGLLGIAVIFGIAYLVSNNKKRINWRLVGMGMAIQIVFGILIIKGRELGEFFAPLGWFFQLFQLLGEGIVKLLGFTTEGAKFVFGNLAISPGPGVTGSLGFFFVFQVLPTIIFFSSLMSVLYYLGVMQKIVQGMAWVMAKLMGTSGAESLSNTANIFVGQTEAPLMIRPFIKTMTQSELLTIMVGGMATIAGGVMAAYIQMLGESFAAAHNLPLLEAQIKFATQLMGASIMAAPAGLAISKIMYPEVEEPVTRGTVKLNVEKNASNVIEAAAGGASDGVQLALNVAGMLLAFIALIALFNAIISYGGELVGINDLSLQTIFGYLLAPLAFIVGVPWNEAFAVGSLLGTKVTLNEFVAYLQLADYIKDQTLTSDKSIMISTFALCGFANFSSIAIQIGGISPLAPERRKDIAALGMRAVLGGMLATLLTGTVAGIIL